MTIGAGGTVILLLAGLLPACTQEAAAVGEKVELRFAWPESGSVVVVETSVRNGTRAEFEYRMEWCPGEPMGSTLIRFAGFRIRTFQGKSLSDEEQHRIAQSLTDLGMSLEAASGVGLLVDENGFLIDTLGVEDLLVSVMASSTERNPDGPTLPELEANLQTDFARDVLAQLGERYWTPWVGGWADRLLPLDHQWSEDAEYPMPGTALLSKVREEWISGELEEDAEGRWLHLRREMVYDADSLSAALLDAASRQFDQLPDGEMPRMARTDRLEILTDVDTLRPRKVMYNREISAGPLKRREQHKWEFDWSGAVPR